MGTNNNASPLVLLSRLLECVRILREETGNDELQAQAASMFLYVASRHPNPVPYGEIERVLGFGQSMVSRNAATLSKGLRPKGQAGYRLLEVTEDVDYRLRKLCTLTPKGVKVSDKLCAALVK